MTPLESIKVGITKGDWELVVSGYNRLTDENVQAPKSKKAKAVAKQPAKSAADDEDFSKVIREGVNNRNRKGPVSEESWNVPTNNEDRGRPPRFEDVDTAKIAAVGNMFEDDSTEHTEDVGIDKLLHSTNHKRQSRPKTQKVKRTCADCNKIFELYQSQITGGELYHCDRCLIRKVGGRR